MEKKEVNEKVGVLGEITAEFFDQSTLSEKVRAKNNKLEQYFYEGLISRIEMIDNYAFGRKFAHDYHHNVICNVGFNAVAMKRMIGDTTYTGKVNKALLGTGVVDETHSAASAVDTKLIDEAYRNDVLSGSENGENITYLTIVFTETEVTGTFTEFGNAIDGAAGVDTGALFSHVTGLNWVKDNLTAIMVSCKYTFASV